MEELLFSDVWLILIYFKIEWNGSVLLTGCLLFLMLLLNYGIVVVLLIRYYWLLLGLLVVMLGYMCVSLLMTSGKEWVGRLYLVYKEVSIGSGLEMALNRIGLWGYFFFNYSIFGYFFLIFDVICFFFYSGILWCINMIYVLFSIFCECIYIYICMGYWCFV